MTAAKQCFVDTNVLLTASDKDRPEHAEAVHFLEAGLRGELRLFTNGQVFREYLVVATRPLDKNGFGLSPQDALGNLKAFGTCIQLLDENQAVTRQLHKLVADYQLKGKRIHDANIVATMRENGLTQLKTYNQADFTAFDGIEFA
jgi:predicted nucleic acid-binding protein